MSLEVRESQVEDILVSAPILTKRILSLEQDPRLLSRQMLIPSGRLDLLYAHRTELLLVELKVVPFKKRFVRQLCTYADDLRNLQQRGELLQGKISPYLLVTHATPSQCEAALANEIVCRPYDPEEILRYFYSNLKPIALFTETKPIDIGIWNIHLVHNLLYAVQSGLNSVKELRKQITISPRTLYNKIRFSRRHFIT